MDSDDSWYTQLTFLTVSMLISFFVYYWEYAILPPSEYFQNLVQIIT